MTVPDGFNPHTELERIYNLRDLMMACRQRTPVILNLADQLLSSEDVTSGDKIKVMDMMLNRGYGKPRQTVYISEANQEAEKRVQVYLPDNGRSNLIDTKTIDMEADNN
jgi:hypothetical protein